MAPAATVRDPVSALSLTFQSTRAAWSSLAERADPAAHAPHRPSAEVKSEDERKTEVVSFIAQDGGRCDDVGVAAPTRVVAPGRNKTHKWR